MHLQIEDLYRCTCTYVHHVQVQVQVQVQVHYKVFKLCTPQGVFQSAYFALALVSTGPQRPLVGQFEKMLILLLHLHLQILNKALLCKICIDALARTCITCFEHSDTNLLRFVMHVRARAK